MKHLCIDLGGGSVLTTYFPDHSEKYKIGVKRPAILICPGGGYGSCVDHEAEPIALDFCARGFAAAVLYYRCADKGVLFPNHLCAAARAMAWLRRNAAEYHIDPERIAVSGFSAGGHLAGSLGVFWNAPFLAEATGLAPQEMRPDRMVLCYPVITSGEYAHTGSFERILGDACRDPEKRDFVSLEKQVTADTPPAFLWHTFTDTCVPVENTMLFAMALRRAGVPFEAHIYSVGPHGLALADERTQAADGTRFQPECAGWSELAAAWLLR